MATIAEKRKTVKKLNLTGVSANDITKMSETELDKIIADNAMPTPTVNNAPVSTAVKADGFYTAKNGDNVPTIKATFVSKSLSGRSFLFDYQGLTISSSHPALAELNKAGFLQAGDSFVFKAELVNDASYAHPLARLVSSANEIVISQLEVIRENDNNLSDHLRKINKLQVSDEVKIASQTQAINEFYPAPKRRVLTLSRN